MLPLLQYTAQKERWNVAALGHVAANRSELTGIWRSCCRTPLHEMAHGKGCLAGALLDSFLPLMYTWKRKTLQNHVTDSSNLQGLCFMVESCRVLY
jgi:hypothetical protein